MQSKDHFSFKQLFSSFFIFILLFCGSLQFTSESYAQAATCAQPLDFLSKGIDPTTLSAAQLDTYGLPPKPQDSERLALWKSAIQAMKYRVCDSEVPQSTSTIFNNINYINDPHWAGWSGYPVTSFGLTEAQAHWNVPCIVQNTPNAISSHWVGLGGGGTQLLQTGTVSNDDSSGHPYYKAFVENTGPLQSQPEQDKFSVNCGDYMFGEVWLANNALIEDITKGIYWTGRDGYFIGSYVPNWECISEWQGSGSGHPAADFNYTAFSYCDGYNAAGDYQTIMDVPTPANITAVNSAGNAVIVPGWTNSRGDGFNTYWMMFQ